MGGKLLTDDIAKADLKLSDRGTTADCEIRVHEALFEACWPGTQEPILSAHIAKLIWKLSDRGTTARLPKIGEFPTRRSFEPSSNPEKKRGVCNGKVPHLQQEFVPARTRSRKESRPCTPLSPGTTGLFETALQDDRPAACVLYEHTKCQWRGQPPGEASLTANR